MFSYYPTAPVNCNSPLGSCLPLLASRHSSSLISPITSGSPAFIVWNLDGLIGNYPSGDDDHPGSAGGGHCSNLWASKAVSLGKQLQVLLDAAAQAKCGITCWYPVPCICAANRETVRACWPVSSFSCLGLLDSPSWAENFQLISQGSASLWDLHWELKDRFSLHSLGTQTSHFSFLIHLSEMKICLELCSRFFQPIMNYGFFPRRTETSKTWTLLLMYETRQTQANSGPEYDSRGRVKLPGGFIGLDVVSL